MSSTEADISVAGEAREAEKARLAQLKREMELERERMRLELEEEERLAAEEAKRAQQSKESSQGSKDSGDSAGHESSEREDGSQTTETEKKSEKKEKKDKLKDKSSTTSSSASPSKDKRDKKDKREKKSKDNDVLVDMIQTSNNKESPRETTSKDQLSSTDSPKDSPKERKDKKDKTKSSEKAEKAQTVSITSPIESEAAKEKRRKERREKKEKSANENTTQTGSDSALTYESKNGLNSPSKDAKSTKATPTSPPNITISTSSNNSDSIGGSTTASSSNPPIGLQISGTSSIPRVDSGLKIPVLDLSNRRLQEVPPHVPNNTYLTKLYLGRNQINDIDCLASLKELTILSVANNRLSSFPVALSSDASKLKDLSLSDNFISSIPPAFGGIPIQFPVLSKLDLMCNKLSEIPAAVCTLTSLTHLNLSWNKITEIPRSIASLSQLNTFIIHHNQLKRIASAICQLTKLITLEIQDNQLSSIPESIGELISLTNLNASYNLLKELPSCIGKDSQLRALAALDFSHNQIAGAIPEDRFEEDGNVFPALEELYLHHNQISSLPNSLWKNIGNVSVLDLRCNKIESISNEISNLYSLNTLELGSNCLSSIPEDIGTLQSLQVLSVYDNKIERLPDISALEYLQYLNIGHNLIEELVLDGLSSLEELFISGNPLKQLPDTIATTCPNLKLFFASDMLLKKLPAGLSQLALLEQLDLSFNRLTEIPTSFEELESLRSLSFAHNKLESSKEREVLKTPGKGPWDCIEFWQSLTSLIEVDLSHNKLKYLPKGLETKIGPECDVIVSGNPMNEVDKLSNINPRTGKRFQVGWAEMLGRRPTMEDQFCWQGSLNGDNNVDLFAVFDGHAARDAATFCAEHIPQVVSKHLPKEGLPKTDNFFNNVFKELSEMLEKHLSHIRDNSVKHCGTTAVVMIVVDQIMQIANVGDSRAVLNSGERCTVDHKPRHEVERIRAHPGGFVTGDGPGRINEVLAVSRSLGDFYMSPWVISTPNVFSKTLTKDDKYIILACDGIWDEIDDAEAVSIVDKLVAEGELHKACSKLRDIAYCAGSDDNISVMIIKFSNK